MYITGCFFVRDLSESILWIQIITDLFLRCGRKGKSYPTLLSEVLYVKVNVERIWDIHSLSIQIDSKVVSIDQIEYRYGKA